MKKVLIVIDSVRQVRAADGVVGLVQAELVGRSELMTEVVDLKMLNLPLIDSPEVPSSDDFKPKYESVLHWQQLVREADGVIMLTPEYNSSLAPAQKNAIDWLYHQWNKKPVAVVGYGWGGAERARIHLVEILKRVDANHITPHAVLTFEQEIMTDGTDKDTKTVTEKIKVMLDALEDKLLV